jgi:hypothetical protein
MGSKGLVMPDEIELDLEASDRALDRLAKEHPMSEEEQEKQFAKLLRMEAISRQAGSAYGGRCARSGFGVSGQEEGERKGVVIYFAQLPARPIKANNKKEQR